MKGIAKIKKACFVSKDGSRQVMLIQKDDGVEITVNKNERFINHNRTINSLVADYKTIYNLTYMEVE